jgi:hypothetical protein
MYQTYQNPGIQNSAPTAPPIDAEALRLQRFRDLCKKYEINSDYASRLRKLEGFEIVFVCDDSGSMSTLLAEKTDSRDPYEKRKSRWDELCSIVSVVVEIAGILDPTGIDLYFLNRPAVRNIFSVSQVDVL